MEMYDIVEIALVGLAFVLGLVMTVAPKSCTKKEFQDDPAQVAKIRRNGIILMVIGAVVIVGMIILKSLS